MSQPSTNNNSLNPAMEDSYYFYQIASMMYIQMQYISTFSKNLDKKYLKRITKAKLDMHELLDWIESEYGYRTEYLREDLLSLAV